ncbi:hypothetical protein V8F20_003896 [Naviculisporaceae sp. PSN 640]
MMDPVSITGLVGTCLSLVANTAKTIKTLHDLKSKFTEVAVEIAHLLSQVSTVQSSVQLIQKWLDLVPPALHSNVDLRVTIEQALDDCIVIISALERHVARIAYTGGAVPVRGKIRHVFSEEELAANQRALGYQVQALTLLLQAIQMTSVVEQQQLLAKEEARAVLKRARDDASSYVDLSGEQLSVLQGTIASDATANLDATFDFDDLALDSFAYRSAFRSFMRKEYEDQRRKKRSESATPYTQPSTDLTSLPSSKASSPPPPSVTTATSNFEIEAPSSSSSIRSSIQDIALIRPGLPTSNSPSLSSIPGLESPIQGPHTVHTTKTVSTESDLVEPLGKAEEVSCDGLNEDAQSEAKYSSELVVSRGKPGGGVSPSISPDDSDGSNLCQDTLSVGTEPQDTELELSSGGSLYPYRGLILDTEYSGTHPLGVLRLHIIGATGVGSSTFSRSKPDTYVHIEVSGTDASVDGKTKLCEKNDAPEYDEVLHIPLFTVDSVITLKVMKSRRFLADECLGFTRLGGLDDFLPKEAGDDYRAPRERDFLLHGGQKLQYGKDLFGGFLKFRSAFFFSALNAFQYIPPHSTGGRHLSANGEGLLYRSGLFAFTLTLLDKPSNIPYRGSIFFMSGSDSPSTCIINTRRESPLKTRFLFISDLHSNQIRLGVWKDGLGPIGTVKKQAKEWIWETGVGLP